MPSAYAGRLNKAYETMGDFEQFINEKLTLIFDFFAIRFMAVVGAERQLAPH
nr:hypothetical protein [uncultured Cohaesibacter sp.]